MILFAKYGQHQPLNRQADRYAREGVPLSLSTLADQVGACVAVLAPLLRRVEGHVFAAERLHGDDTTVPVLARGRCSPGAGARQGPVLARGRRSPVAHGRMYAMTGRLPAPPRRRRCSTIRAIAGATIRPGI
jgi:hypothetical protein